MEECPAPASDHLRQTEVDESHVPRAGSAPPSSQSTSASSPIRNVIPFHVSIIANRPIEQWHPPRVRSGISRA